MRKLPSFATIQHVSIEDFLGFGMRGYRSYGDKQLQRFGPMAPLHLISGINNSGKSNALLFARDVLKRIKDTRSLDGVLGEGDELPDDYPADRRSLTLGFARTPDVAAALGIPSDWPEDHLLVRLLSTEAFASEGHEIVWLEFDFLRRPDGSFSSAQPSTSQVQKGRAQGRIPESEFYNFTLQHKSRASSSFSDNYSLFIDVPTIADLLPEVGLLNANRELGDSTTIRPGDDATTAPWATGRGILSLLAAIQNPPLDNLKSDGPKWALLQAFVRDVLDDADASIQVDVRQSDLIVKTGRDHTTFRRLGTGIAEVVLIGAAATVNSGKLICIEEPELHLHPTLQRKVVKFLKERSNNRYLLSTHSAAMLDAPQVSVSHITKNDSGNSVVDEALLPTDRSRVVFDLGNRASDLVQANFVIWVEGPSDRVYVRLWLYLTAPDLEEGTHFSIVFYGGGLLNHLSASDPVVGDFINLTRINQRLAILIDSDRRSPNARLNATKTRVIGEARKTGAHIWVTGGYTIENYVPTDVLLDALRAAYPRRPYFPSEDKYSSPIAPPFSGMATGPDKVIVAREVAALTDDLSRWPFGLQDNVISLVAAIRKANS